MLLFNRTASLTVGNVVFNVRLNFNIEKEMTTTGGKAEIKAYNLSKNHRNSVEDDKAKNRKIYLSAGYDGQNKLIYAGSIFFAHSEREKADIITTFETLPASVALQQAFLKISGNIDDYGIYQQCLQALAPFGGIKGHLSGAAQKALKAGIYSKGFADSGTVSKFMDMITKRHSLKWNISREALNIFAKGEFEDQQEVLLSSDTGMIGFPSKVAANNYKAKSLLNPEMEPGRRVKLISKQLKLPGDLKVIKSVHVGDTLEGDWYTEIEANVLGFGPNFTGAGE